MHNRVYTREILKVRPRFFFTMKSTSCPGFLETCGKLSRRGEYCDNHYRKYLENRTSLELCSSALDQKMQFWSLCNPLMHQKPSQCTNEFGIAPPRVGTRCKNNCSLTFPLCTNCCSTVFGLEVKGSMIPGAGFGLFATRDFFPTSGSPMYLECTYDGAEIDMETYEQIMLNENSDDRLEFQSRYLFAMTNHGPFVDGTKGGSILRFINNSPSRALVNCKFVRIGSPGNYKLVVQIISNISTGCELLLVYNNSQNGCLYMNQTRETDQAINQRIAILQSLKK